MSNFIPPVLRPDPVSRSAVLAGKRIDNPSREPIRSFPTQQLAFDYADNKPTSDFQVWAYELDRCGRRRFLVASRSSLWRWYQRVLRRQAPMHIYEVIREGRACKLYYDLEFHRIDTETKSLDGWMMTSEVIRATKRTFELWCGVEEPCRAENYIELDSSTSEKFSVHLIFPKIVFVNNNAAGMFVSDVIDVLPEVCRKYNFVDTSVYTKNRCFRLIASSKFGRSARLLPTRSPAAAEAGARQKSSSRVSISEHLFNQSLVSANKSMEEKLLGTAWSVSRSPPQARTDTTMHNASNQAQKHRINELVKASHFHPSHLSQIDEFVLRIVQPHGGSIYTMSYFADSHTLSYAIKGRYRYCHRIGRHHRSNNIILVVSIPRQEMHQRCFDPECRGFRSVPWKLPNSLFGDMIPRELPAPSDDLDDALNHYMNELEGGDPDHINDLSGGISDDIFLELARVEH